jgi:hypothetical protein
VTNQDHEQFARWDGSYVLGALSAPERVAFEDHLSRCAECEKSVRQLSHLPGLLSALPTAVVVDEIDDAVRLADRPDVVGDEPPPTLLPGVIRRVARERRQRRWRAGAMSLAAACAAAATAVVILSPWSSDQTPRPTTAMSAVVPAPIHALVSLRSVESGTEVTVTCSYDSNGGYAPTRSYALRVTGRDGQIQQLSTWRISPDAPITATSTTSLDRDQIKSVEITTSEGAPVLRLNV